MSAVRVSVAEPVVGKSKWLAAARPRTMTAAVLPVVVGLAAAHRVRSIDVLVACATLAAAILIQTGTNLANDYYDFLSGADTSERLGPVRVTQAGLIQPVIVRNAAFVVLSFALVIGCYLVCVGGWPIMAIGAASVVSALAYTAGPYPLAYHGLGDGFVFAFFGLVAVNGTTFLQIGEVTTVSLLASVPVACLATAILVVNNLRDIDTDRKAGKRTLAVQFGARFARIEYTALVTAAFAMICILAWIGGAIMLLPFAALAMAIGSIRSIHREVGASLNKELGRTAALHAVFGLLLALAIVL